MFFTVCVCTLSLCWGAGVVFGDSMLMRSLVWRSGAFMHSLLTQFKTQTRCEMHPQSSKPVIPTVS